MGKSTIPYTRRDSVLTSDHLGNGCVPGGMKDYTVTLSNSAISLKYDNCPNPGEGLDRIAPFSLPNLEYSLDGSSHTTSKLRPINFGLVLSAFVNPRKKSFPKADVTVIVENDRTRHIAISGQDLGWEGIDVKANDQIPAKVTYKLDKLLG